MEFEGKESLLALTRQQMQMPSEADMAMMAQDAEQQALESELQQMPTPETALA